MIYICLLENEFEKKTVYKRDKGLQRKQDLRKVYYVIKYVKVYACYMKTQQLSGVVHNTTMELMDWKGCLAISM
jgi:hypothetical protein